MSESLMYELFLVNLNIFYKIVLGNDIHGLFLVNRSILLTGVELVIYISCTKFVYLAFDCRGKLHI